MAKMTKAEIVAELAQRLQTTKVYAESVVEAIFGQEGLILSNLNSPGDTVRFTDFGVFGVKSRGARNGRNPKTGAPVQVPAKTSRTFKFSLNGKSV